jgi:2-polyprenyl-3-methyl-5-hydroxy-6-metoxy-1,4-benzoquinol methylase
MRRRGRRIEGTSPLIHMMLVARAPERILALRLAMSAAIGPSSVVLDAGCGPLGVLAIMAARLGARRVVAVDTAPLEVARTLAEENGVADRVEFRQGDLARLPAATGSFDVILGMIYHNEPRRDLAQQQLMAALATRFAHPSTVFIPDTVRYTVAGYDSAGPDRTERTLHDRWDSAVGGAEAVTGITMEAMHPFPGADYSAFIEHMSQARALQGARSAGLGQRDLTLLTRRAPFTEISYADPATAAAYPPALALAVTAPGRLDTTVWCQELKHGDLLIRRTETTYPLTPPRDVQPGDTAILSTDRSWGDAIPLSIRPGDRS